MQDTRYKMHSGAGQGVSRCALGAHLAVSVPVRRAECLRAILGAVCAPATGQRAATPAPCADSRRVADLVTPIQFLNSIKLV